MTEITWDEFLKEISGLTGDIWPYMAAVVPEKEWIAAKGGDEEAIARIKGRLHGVELYDHAFYMQEGDILVTVQELAAAEIIKGVTLDCGQELNWYDYLKKEGLLE